MSNKSLALFALAAALASDQGPRHIGFPVRKRKSTISVQERKRRTKLKKAAKKQRRK